MSLELDLPPRWPGGAPLCNLLTSDLFFPVLKYMDDYDGGGGYVNRELAQRTCRVCPVRVPCLEYAMARPELDGIWGGLTERQRTRRRTKIAEARKDGSNSA
jgi:hypothetical protein